MFLLFVSDDPHDMVTVPVAPMCSVTLSLPMLSHSAVLALGCGSRGKVRLTAL